MTEDTSPNPPVSSRFNRRTFVKTAAGAAAAAGALGLNQPARGQGVPADKPLKIGFIGCGGRGTGAAAQALSADDNIQLHAMADVFQERIDTSLESLSKNKAIADKIQVAPERQFVGMDAYKRVLDSDVDVVILTTTPGFRPIQLRAAVEAGKHIFAEKPMAVDAAGVRHVMETVEMSKSKPISVVAGFCWRYSPSRVAAYEQVMTKGLIGEVTGVYATYYSSHSKPHIPATERPAGMSDIEWQIRNWYNYTWLGGGGLVEQAVHSVDKIGWVMGDQNPIACRATGGLAVPQAGGGNIFDHYHVAYQYPNNVWCHLASRKTPGCYNENADYVRGTDGTLVIGRGVDPYIENNKGEKIWRWRKPRPEENPTYEDNMYQVEHNDLFASIRSGEHINDGDRMVHSTMMAIMGRMSAHTGQELTWDDALNAEEDLGPDAPAWDASFEPSPVARPGETTFFDYNKQA